MKYTYIHSPFSKDLICVEKHLTVPIELPPLLPVNTYGERVKKAELEAIERFERIY